jgi:hypothetical protein
MTSGQEEGRSPRKGRLTEEPLNRMEDFGMEMTHLRILEDTGGEISTPRIFSTPIIREKRRSYS